MTDAPRLDRRALLGCAAVCGVAGPLLAACSSDRAGGSGDGGAGADGPDDAPSSTKPGTALVAAAEVPVGGGVALTDLRLVVTQPSEGEFKAWSGICTHQGGAISRVEAGEMICSLHQSHFAIDDGAAVSGPASNALPEIEVTVRDGQVVRA